MKASGKKTTTKPPNPLFTDSTGSGYISTMKTKGGGDVPV
jgi:hypothetical protein